MARSGEEGRFQFRCQETGEDRHQALERRAGKALFLGPKCGEEVFDGFIALLQAGEGVAREPLVRLLVRPAKRNSKVTPLHKPGGGGGVEIKGKKRAPTREIINFF